MVDRMREASNLPADNVPEGLEKHRELLERLEREILPSMAKRVEVAENLEWVTLRSDEVIPLWGEARTRIRDADSRYGDFDLEPVLGLFPLGPNEAGLEEFWLVTSGERPTPSSHAARSRWLVTPQTGLVFVLIPGITFSMGAEPPTIIHWAGSANVDVFARHNESPVHDVTLDAFLISKYEMTQSQWHDLMGENPSKANTTLLPDLIHDTHPAENVS